MTATPAICLPRYATPRRPERPSRGEEVGRIMRALGKEPMPWQQMVWDVGLELLPNGRPAYREVWFTTPRQSGKTETLLSVEVHRALLWSKEQPQRIFYSAQTGADARKKLLEDQVPIIEASPLKQTIQRIYVAAGAERIIFKSGSRIDVMASGEAAGHGRTVDLGILDEVFADQDDRREQATKPAMATKPEAQLWGASTQGHEGSVYLNRKIDNGRAAVTDGLDTGVAYFEWSADPDADIEDPATWYSCMPALGHTIDESVIRDALASMSESEFRRSFLNQRTVGMERVIPTALWTAVSRSNVTPAESGLTFGLDVDPRREHASIVTIDNERRAELVEYRDGMAGLADRVAEVTSKWNAPVAVDVQGPAGSIVPDLELRGVQVVPYSGAEMPAACGRFYDAVADGGISIRSHPILDLAVGGARKRMVSDRWTWVRRDGYVDISPLVALTIAYDCSTNIARSGGTLWASWA
jgi:hypothetical protein